MATWTPTTKNAATFATTTKNAATFASTSKSGSVIIYLVSEALDFYLVGTAENETLITQDAVTWTALTKN